MDESAFCGCYVPCRLLGVIEADQTENGKTTRNDRLIAVYANAQTHKDIKSVRDLSKHLIEEIQHFFISYNQVKGKKFQPLGCKGPKTAARLVKKGKRKRDRRYPSLVRKILPEFLNSDSVGSRQQTATFRRPSSRRPLCVGLCR